MKLKSAFLILALTFCSYLIVAQTTISVNPPRLDPDASPGLVDIQLLFEGDSLPWTASIDSDWVSLDTLMGTGTTDLLLEFSENQGSRRVARIIFEVEGDSIEPYIFEIRQFQRMPTIMMPVEFSVLEFPNYDPVVLPYTARASFNYQPLEDVRFFSLLIRKYSFSNPVWVVQNIPLPESSWHDSIQAISARFDLGLIGYDHGQTIDYLQYAYTISTEPDTMAPVIPDYAYIDAEIRSTVINALGRKVEDILVPDTLVTYYTPDWILPFEITDKYYIGCEMVNGDLDGTAYSNDDGGCGPAAAANSLKWLMKKHKDTINWPSTWHDGFNELATLMEHKNGSGVDDKDFIRGKLDIIEAYNLPVKVKYQDNNIQGEVQSTSGNSSAECFDSTSSAYPSKKWLINEIKEGEDVEIGMTYSSGEGHWVVLTGTHSLNGRTGIFYKHDADQSKKDPDEVQQEHSWIMEEGGKLKLANEGNAEIDIVVSESYDPDYTPEPDTAKFNKYCQSIKRTIAPGKSLSISYPENDKRCFNTTVRVLNRDDGNSYKKVANWNHNSGKTRKYKNNTGKVVTVEFHNDDYFDGGTTLLKSYEEFTVVLSEIDNDVDGVTDPGNTDEFGGLSIGTDDGSWAEFGNFAGPEATYFDSVGCYLNDFPQKFSFDGVKKITIQTEVTVLNRYWNNLGLVLGIDSIAQSGPMKISCPSTGYSQTFEFVDPGDFKFILGGVVETGIFELVIELEDRGSYFFDNVGIPSLIQVEPIIDFSTGIVEFDNADAASKTIDIINRGGSDLIWFITNDTDWITVEPENGINETTVTISCMENTSTEERTAELTVTGYKARNTPLSFTVTQPGSTESVDNIGSPEYSLSVYPNPNSGSFDIELVGLIPGNLKIRLTSIIGKEVWQHSEKISNTNWNKQLELNNLTKGIYFLNIENGKGILRKMVIIR